jgi:large subunit ribosomal protein L28
MSRVCAICGKTSLKGNRVSHSNIKTKVSLLANLQPVKAKIDGAIVKIRACTRCIRSGKFEKAV